MAEAVFLRLIKERGVEKDWYVDSAAMGTWHIGKGPYTKTIETLNKFKITDYNHTVRQVTQDDYAKFDVIFGMDKQNMSDLEDRKPKKCTAQLKLLGDYHPEGKIIIVDPYFDDNIKDFETVYEQCCRCCEGYLNSVTGTK